MSLKRTASARSAGGPAALDDHRHAVEAGADDGIHIIDAAELSAAELAQERKAAMAEMEKLTWLSHTPEQLANRIPVSVFAMGDLASA